MPAMPFPYFSVLLSGDSCAERGGKRMASPRSFAVGALSRPVSLRISAGAVFASAQLRLSQLQTLFGIASHELTDQSWPLGALIGRAEEEALFDSLHPGYGAWQWTDPLSD